jgi:hypothetical protein
MIAFVLGVLLALDFTPPIAPGPYTHAHHAISSTDPDAQRLFDEALTLLYAFDPQDAVTRFREAAKADPQSAMAQWGIALAYGPNINESYNLAGARSARLALERAKALAPTAAPEERAYIAALAERYRATRKGDIDRSQQRYSAAMRDLVTRYPDDLDAAALYAESLMDLQPWDLWDPSGKPAGDEKKIQAMLESVLARDPQHILANHLYIHVMEAAPQYDAALPSADRLAAMNFEPAAEHLVHMPSHIYLRDGQYAKAIAANDDALAHFAAWKTGPHDPQHGGYVYHDAAMKFAAELMAGRLKESLATARSAEFDAGDTAVIETNLRFHRWSSLLAITGKPTSQLHAYARALAFAATGNLAAARAARTAFEPFASDDRGRIERVLIDAAIARASGVVATAIADLEDAVKRQDALGYDEPPHFYYPVRETLGALYLKAGHAADAKRTFEADLQRNGGNPRSLFGLAAALDALQLRADAATTRAAFEAAWHDADVPLHLDDL